MPLRIAVKSRATGLTSMLWVNSATVVEMSATSSSHSSLSQTQLAEGFVSGSKPKDREIKHRYMLDVASARSMLKERPAEAAEAIEGIVSVAQLSDSPEKGFQVPTQLRAPTIAGICALQPTHGGA